ncbi:AMP-binding protein [Streptomyces durmitorensis]|uniref:AMP-binding protein n=1 Tax=Streptomyces durmitorensis TaxID=319947 RepID=A0ABY4PM42_9ACTN|nr:AMP-binding protein [Streptomyces durmitorensis]UQT54796.1 AMP-binding protein [Streptomyces durmitorensis]
MSVHHPEASLAFRAARDVLLDHHGDPDGAREAFSWPRLTHFNWAFDWFDVIAEGNTRTALHLVAPRTADDERISYDELFLRSDQVAHWLRDIGVRRGDRLLIALHNGRALWETMLAAIKLGAVVVPTYATATPADLADRLLRAKVKHVLTDASLTDRFADVPGKWTRLATGAPVPGWLSYADSWAASGEQFLPDVLTPADDPLFLYFTSGTTSRPKMVAHTHSSYPVGHLSGMFWNGLRPGDAHLNISAPGWAKHAWSSFFVPWNAEATVVALTDPRPAAGDILDAVRTRDIHSFCAPPTIWRGLMAEGLGAAPPLLREATCAGEPLDASLIARVAGAWGVQVRDGYGQTETTAQLGHVPGTPPVPGTMGSALPGYDVVVVDPASGLPTAPGATGELCLELTNRPMGLMTGYLDDEEKTARAFAGGRYHTGDLVTLGMDGALRYAGRDDDMFKSFDHRISPLELERVLLRHPAVAQAAVVPVPDPVGQWVPKAFVVLTPDWIDRDGVGRALLDFAATELPPEKAVRVLETAARLPMTVSGKVRRAELRASGTLGSQEVRAELV